MLILYILAALLAVCLAVFAVTFILLKLNMRPGKAPELAQLSVAKRTRWAPYAETVSALILELRTLPWEDVYIQSFDGLRLHAKQLRGRVKDSVVLVHGYRSSGENDFAGIAQYYISRGFSVLLIDQRAHGESEGREISFGTREREDVRRWAEYAQGELGGRLWLHGVSMGAATVLMAAGEGFPCRVDGIVADSSFTSPRDVLAYQMTKQYHLPQFPFVPIGTLAGMLIAGRDFALGSVVRASAAAKEPLLFVCGLEDRSLPGGSTEKLREARGGRDPILCVPGAKHALCWLRDPEAYARALDEFIPEA